MSTNDRILLGGEGEQAALSFVDALAHVYAQIGRHPTIGSLRYAHELNLPGLRCWRLAHYPYLVFYIERIDHVDVRRVLHAQLDNPVWMGENEAP